MTSVLHVISGLQMGGAETALLRLIVSSRNGKCSHEVFSLTLGGAMLERFRDANVKVTVFDFKHSPLSEFMRLIRLLRARRPDIVQTWMYHGDLIGGLAARLSGIRNVIWGIRTTDITVGGASRATAMARNLCAKLSGLIPRKIVCAADAARRAHITVGYAAKCMVVVPNGFDLARLAASHNARNELRKQCGIADGEIVIGSLGRFNPAKDHHTFVKAAGGLAQKHADVRFLLIGPGLDADNAQLMEWIRETGYAGRFVLLGQRSDIAACYSAMDVFCLHSRTEGFPNVVGEAMAMGVPCVVTDVGDAAMLIADTGVVVPRSNPAALAGGLGELIRMSANERMHLGMKAKNRIHAEFTVERMRERFESIYQELVGKGA